MFHRLLFQATIGPMLALALLAPKAWSVPDHVILIRHAEKPDKEHDDGNLSPTGHERAAKLPDFFLNPSFAQDHGLPPGDYTPAGIYAFQMKKNGKRARGMETVSPLASRLALPVQTTFTEGQEQEMVNWILTDPRYEGKTVLICWEHKKIIDIVHAFSVSQKVINNLTLPTEWPKASFDRVWILDLGNHGKIKAFYDIPQNLLPGDSTL